MNNQDDFSLLAAKVLSGEANEEERAYFSEILRENEENPLIYNQLKEYWNSDVVLDQSILNSVQENIDTKIEKTRRKKSKQSNLTILFYRVAVIALILLASGVLFYHKTHPIHTYSFVTQEAPADYVLGDGTKVKLNKNSSLTYTSHFDGNSREVNLRGEAFFDVQKNPNKPFVVYAQDTKTEVLGTRFNVLSNEKKHEVIVSLEEGSVRFGADKCDVILVPEEAITYQAGTNNYHKQMIDLQFNTAWTKGRYVYSDISFGDLLNKLEHIYKISIAVDDSKIKEKKISVSFVIDQPIEEILFVLEDELNFRYKILDASTIEIVNK